MMSSTSLNYNQAYVSPFNLKCNFREYSILNAPLLSISRRMKCLCHSNILQSRGTQESSLRGQRLRWLQSFRVEQRKAHVMKLSSTPFWIHGPRGAGGKGFSVHLWVPAFPPHPRSLPGATQCPSSQPVTTQMVLVHSETL